MSRSGLRPSSAQCDDGSITASRPVRTSFAGAVAATLYLVVLLNPPLPWPGSDWSPSVPLEVLALVPLLIGLRMLGRRLRHALFRSLALFLLILFALSVADGLLRGTFGRPLDVPLDMHLIPALIEFVRDALGPREAILWIGGILAASALVYRLNLAAVRTLTRTFTPRAAASGLAVLVLAVSAVHAFTGQSVQDPRCIDGLPLTCRSSAVLGHQVESALDLWRPLPVFDQALSNDPLADGTQGLLGRLADTDVLLVFVESYGTTALRDPRYAAKIEPELKKIGEELKRSGLSVASGALEAPTVGGLSWLSHGTMLSGLWLNNQRLYDRLITSRRRTLVDLFGEAGHTTVGIFPQTLHPWPEGRFFGYDQIWTARNIEYAGPRFGWTTMPDQYTLWFLQWKERQEERRPLFAEVALISSHAPWEPVPSILDDWKNLGRGERFSGMVEPEWNGPTGWPEEAPENYVRTIAYSLDSIGEFARRFVDRHTLMIVLGDHQPAPLITGATQDRTVPVHVIAEDPDLIVPFREWGFETSMQPVLDSPAKRMDAFRDWFVEAFSEGHSQHRPSRLEQ